MDQPIAVTRDLELDMSPDELWSLVGDGDRWPEWMVDQATVEVAPGRGGTVHDRGVDRDVFVREVAEGERVAFDWWERARPDVISTVELVVAPTATGAGLRIIETFPAAPAVVTARADAAWSVRSVGLWLRGRVRVLA